ncbi:MAG: hypothetical protein EOP07_17800 [Proteobacteria bacterium]|nr:MAG: hypothetical protein EOP07_17800 [Pseudomonadota bacterium]
MFWKRLTSGRICVYRYDNKTKRQRSIARERTRHLDHEPDDVIEQWVQRFEALERVLEMRPDLVSPGDNSETLVERFCHFLLHDQQRKSITIFIHRYNLVNYVLPYFHNVCKVSSLQDYQNFSRRLATWLLTDLKISDGKARYVHMSLRVFWRWLIEEGLVENVPLVLRRIKKPVAVTPLKFTLAPDALLSWKSARQDLRLIALIGYFFSLRPQETLALNRDDFVAGVAARSLECCQVLEAVGLYGRLAVSVSKQRANISKRVTSMA